jgi:hypothetical protein
MNDVRNRSRRMFALMLCCFVYVWLAPLHAADLPRTRMAVGRPGTGAVLLTVEAELATTIETCICGASWNASRCLRIKSCCVSLRPHSR